MGCGIQSKPKVTELYPSQGLLFRNVPQSSIDAESAQEQNQSAIVDPEITEVNTENYDQLTSREEQNQTPISQALRQSVFGSAPTTQASTNELVENISGNGLKKLLIIGRTGVGTSSLCNVISGHLPNSGSFPVSEKPESCTRSALFGNIFFGGNRAKPLSIIDATGFNEPDTDADAQILADLVVKLRNQCDYINIIAIAINGQNCRADRSLIEMIKILEEMFGEKLWSHAVLIITRVSMSKKESEKRHKYGESDKNMAAGFVNAFRNSFPQCKKLKHLMIDSHYDVDDPEEKEPFDKSMEQLWSMLQESQPLETKHVIKVEIGRSRLQSAVVQLTQDKKESGPGLHEDMQNYKQQQSKPIEHGTEKQNQIQMKISELNSRKEELLKNLNKILEQKQLDQDHLNWKLINEGAELDKKQTTELEEIKKQGESLQPSPDHQSKDDKKMQQRKENLDKQELELQTKHEVDKKKLEAKYRDKINIIEEEKQRVLASYEKQFTDLKTETVKLKADLTEVPLEEEAVGRSQILRKMSRSDKKVPSNGEWHRSAYDLFKSSNGDFRKKVNITRAMLDKQYPESYWAVFAIDTKGDWNAGIFGGEEARKSGKEDELVIKDILVANDGKGFECTLYIWKATKSDVNLRVASTAEQETIMKIKSSLECKMKSQSPNVNWSAQKWSEELVEQLNEKSITWKHLVVTKQGFSILTFYSYFYVQDLTIAICFT